MPSLRFSKPSTLSVSITGVAVAVLVTTAPVQALPSVPLAPNGCQQWVFQGNHTLKFGGDYLQFYSKFKNEVQDRASGRRDGENVSGDIVGAVYADGNVRLIYQVPGKELFFNGSVISDGRVTGAYYASGGNPAVFEIPEPLRCLDAPKPEEPKTPDAPKHAITGDVDVYTVPGGVGRPIGFVKKGTEVKILTRQTDNWVQVSGDGVPGGTGWIWGDFVK